MTYFKVKWTTCVFLGAWQTWPWN